MKLNGYQPRVLANAIVGAPVVSGDGTERSVVLLEQA